MCLFTSIEFKWFANSFQQTTLLFLQEVLSTQFLISNPSRNKVFICSVYIVNDFIYFLLLVWLRSVTHQKKWLKRSDRWRIVFNFVLSNHYVHHDDAPAIFRFRQWVTFFLLQLVSMCLEGIWTQTLFALLSILLYLVVFSQYCGYQSLSSRCNKSYCYSLECCCVFYLFINRDHKIWKHQYWIFTSLSATTTAPFLLNIFPSFVLIKWCSCLWLPPICPWLLTLKSTRTNLLATTLFHSYIFPFFLILLQLGAGGWDLVGF